MTTPINWTRVLKLAGVSSLGAYVVAYAGTAVLYVLIRTATPTSLSAGHVQAILAPLAAILAFLGVVLMAVGAAVDD